MYHSSSPLQCPKSKPKHIISFLVQQFLTHAICGFRLSVFENEDGDTTSLRSHESKPALSTHHKTTLKPEDLLSVINYLIQ